MFHPGVTQPTQQTLAPRNLALIELKTQHLLSRAIARFGQIEEKGIAIYLFDLGSTHLVNDDEDDFVPKVLVGLEVTASLETTLANEIEMTDLLPSQMIFRSPIGITSRTWEVIVVQL